VVSTARMMGFLMSLKKTSIVPLAVWRTIRTSW
jgi:hypothetical protein